MAQSEQDEDLGNPKQVLGARAPIVFSLGAASVLLGAAAAGLTASAELASSINAPPWLKVILWVVAGITAVSAGLMSLWRRDEAATSQSAHEPLSRQRTHAQGVEGPVNGIVQQAGGDIVSGDKIAGDRVGRDKIIHPPPSPDR
jgi:hypothetical protein